MFAGVVRAGLVRLRWKWGRGWKNCGIFLCFKQIQVIYLTDATHLP